MKRYFITAEWDSEAGVWVAESDDVPGLATGAETLESLIEKLRIAVPELLEEYGLLPHEDGLEVLFEISAKRLETAVVPRAA